MNGESPGFCIVKFYQPFAAVPVTNKAIVNMTGANIIVKVLVVRGFRNNAMAFSIDFFLTRFCKK